MGKTLFVVIGGNLTGIRHSNEIIQHVLSFTSVKWLKYCCQTAFNPSSQICHLIYLLLCPKSQTTIPCCTSCSWLPWKTTKSMSRPAVFPDIYPLNRFGMTWNIVCLLIQIHIGMDEELVQIWNNISHFFKIYMVVLLIRRCQPCIDANDGHTLSSNY